MDIYSIHTYIEFNSNAQYIEPTSCVLATVYGNCHPHHHRRICQKGHAQQGQIMLTNQRVCLHFASLANQNA